MSLADPIRNQGPTTSYLKIMGDGGGLTALSSKPGDGAKRRKWSWQERDNNRRMIYNPMCEPMDDWFCKFDDSPELSKNRAKFYQNLVPGNKSSGLGEVDCGFTFPTGQSVSKDDDEVTESKIRAFLDEKAAEGALGSGTSRIIGVDLNVNHFNKICKNIFGKVV